MNLEDLLIQSTTRRKHYSADQIMAVLDGGGGGGGGTARVTQVATYVTGSSSPTVYFTALHTDGSPLTARTTSGVTFANGLYQYFQDTTGLTDYIAVWDEGDPAVYTVEWVVVDQ